MLEHAERLRALRAAAAARSARPTSAAVSAEAHRRLEALVEARFEETRGPTGQPEGDRTAAMAAGSVVHRVLEELDLAALAADPRRELARHRSRLGGLLRPFLGPGYDAEAAEAASEARRRIEELLDRLERGEMLARLAALGEHVVARELPVLLPAPATGSDATGSTGPVGFVSGALDLLYRDPETGELVVADYKTDAAETDERIAELAEAYAPQARLYARAVQEALGLPDPPRAELWFLGSGRIVEIDRERPAPTS